jgi:hypothetical protein
MITKMKIRFDGKLLCSLLFILLLAAACAPSTGEAQLTEEEAQHDDGHEHDEDQSSERVPNNGAAIRIVSPTEGTTFQAADEIMVVVEVENFTLGEGNHWHIYVDGSSWGMVMGENRDDTLRGLEPGEHEISVYLSIDTHEELEDGDAVTIVVEE